MMLQPPIPIDVRPVPSGFPVHIPRCAHLHPGWGRFKDGVALSVGFSTLSRYSHNKKYICGCDDKGVCWNELARVCVGASSPESIEVPSDVPRHMPSEMPIYMPA